MSWRSYVTPQANQTAMTINQVRAFFQKYRYPIFIAIAFRIIISLWMMFVGLIIDNFYPYDRLFQASLFGQITPQPTLIGRALLDIWLRWDAVHYMNIAVQGYSGVSAGDYNFAPLYPYLTLSLKWLTFSNVTAAGLLVSTLSTMIAFILLYKLIYELFGDIKLARNTISTTSFFVDLQRKFDHTFSFETQLYCFGDAIICPLCSCHLSRIHWDRAFD